MRKLWKSWRFKNLTILAVSLLVAFFVFQYEPIHQALLHLGTLGYVGAFMGGMLFVSTFTVATGAVILLILAETLSPLEIGVVAGLGAVIGDFTIFRIFQDDLIRELEIIYNGFGGGHFTKVMHSHYFSWTLPVVGALLIASPLPDEVGISLMGISKLKTYQFLLISFLLNAVGIFLVVSASLVIKP
ncbi:MAG: hypothetical protein HY430_01910 [Candidatus Levybacteria bacterium]|nr:hypothetical protein [Candidatus Levybacteria bacterium]